MGKRIKFIYYLCHRILCLWQAFFPSSEYISFSRTCVVCLLQHIIVVVRQRDQQHQQQQPQQTAIFHKRSLPSLVQIYLLRYFFFRADAAAVTQPTIWTIIYNIQFSANESSVCRIIHSQSTQRSAAESTSRHNRFNLCLRVYFYTNLWSFSVSIFFSTSFPLLFSCSFCWIPFGVVFCSAILTPAQTNNDAIWRTFLSWPRVVVVGRSHVAMSVCHLNMVNENAWNESESNYYYSAFA